MNTPVIIVSVIQVIVSLILLSAWAVIIYYAIRKWRRRRTDTDTGTPPIIYGAWQGHMLGTTTLDPGDITEIEKDLTTAAKHSENP
jgi:hypothetical protein